MFGMTIGHCRVRGPDRPPCPVAKGFFGRRKWLADWLPLGWCLLLCGATAPLFVERRVYLWASHALTAHHRVTEFSGIVFSLPNFVFNAIPPAVPTPRTYIQPS